MANVLGGSGTGVDASTDVGTAVRASTFQCSACGIAVRTTGTSWFTGDSTPLASPQDETGLAVGSLRFSGVGYIFSYNYFRNGPETLALNHMGGNVGIGALTPTRTLTVNGRARVGSIPPEASVASVCFNAAGDLLQCGASSLRLKTDVKPFNRGLDIVQRLRPISFNWKEDGRPDIGLAAEDVAKIDPSLTFTDGGGEVAGVKYDRLNILLINVVHDQQAEIEGLKKIVCLDHPAESLCK